MAKKYKNHKQKRNKYDNLSKPQAEFDFHDHGILTLQDIEKMTNAFLEQCRGQKLTKVLFITGKGIHSKKGMPVIKPFLKKYLSEHPLVHQVYEGRFDRGGSGVLEVVLSE